MHSQTPTVTILVALATLAACGDRGGAEGPWEFKVDSSAGARPRHRSGRWARKARAASRRKRPWS